MSRVRRILAVLLVMGAIAACGSDETSSTESSAEITRAPTTAPATDPTTPSTSETAATAQPDTEPEAVPEPVLGEELVGRWAHYDVVAYEDDVL